MKHLTINVSLIFLGVCVLAGAWMVSNALQEQNQAKPITVNAQAPAQQQLMSPIELKSYLGISDEELEKIMPKRNGDDIESIIPYIKIGYQYYFPVEAIDEWLAEADATAFE
ncbi:helix-turn-helix domain-containing protein [Halobacillus locisalis]|uniref:Helix-turn-helix domain-containing protein n=1 Tax=Halobacillus locisalis TaxID=220753 RepID=A0A838CW47_9BACI|nr:helix-turn-helix domain-containing protein [Halobacillus locisalis]MBA2176154.1 helix-turn-helix domain-containing protein [Halobacillus locisalis]